MRRNGKTVLRTRIELDVESSEIKKPCNLVESREDHPLVVRSDERGAEGGEFGGDGLTWINSDDEEKKRKRSKRQFVAYLQLC